MCDHPTFTAAVMVHRLDESQQGNDLACMVDLQVRCDACDTPLSFAQPDSQILLYVAISDATGSEVRLAGQIGTPLHGRDPADFRVLPPTDPMP